MASICKKALQRTRPCQLRAVLGFQTLAPAVRPISCKILASSRTIPTPRISLHTTPYLCDDEESEEKEKETKNRMKLYKYEPTDVETSIRYLQSKAYQLTYKGQFVWVPYRRNHKGRFPPRKTRLTCVRAGHISTGNPCPICRDEYLVLHPKNLELLKQFISPISGDIISYEKTGLCQKQHKLLTIAVLQAWDLGYLERPMPFRKYDYSSYYPSVSN